jgi:hypothetical protein
MFEKCQNAQAADLFPPLCVVFFCRASARLQKSALIGEKISRLWAFRHLSNKAYTVNRSSALRPPEKKTFRRR